MLRSDCFCAYKVCYLIRSLSSGGKAVPSSLLCGSEVLALEVLGFRVAALS